MVWTEQWAQPMWASKDAIPRFGHQMAKQLPGIGGPRRMNEGAGRVH